MAKNDRVKGILLTALGATCWGASGVFSQSLFSGYGVGASWLTAVRMIFGGALLVIAAVVSDRKQAVGAFRNIRDFAWLLAFAFLGLLLCQFSYMSAISYSNAAAATVLQSLSVVIMAVITSIWDRTRISIRQAIAVGLAVLGTYLMATGGHPGTMKLTGMGLTMGLLSAVGAVSYILLSKPIIRKYGSMAVTGWGMVLGGLAAGAVSKVWNVPSGLDAKAYITLLFVITIGTAVAFSVFLEGAKYIPASEVTLIGCLEPASAAVLSLIFLHTKFGWADAAGFFCIMATVFLSTKLKEGEDSALDKK